ncbi:GNAT family N-acetyltransferase [Bacillus sp. BRMEA1]|uniref:GNAT family N-acetyltransferase n=1 Tax=Neobacillus endophyticus TaxID=2738405 RepID=UPI0015665C2A|nr:GNAT family N-acetyltransferase [Neobacillus endophyticus]NRD77129.1 GNAT family N-acetyltransferase [Neobacillus endophyticus]
MENIIYKINETITPEEMSIIFKASGIRRPADDLPRLQKMIDHADILITAWVDQKLVGIARALTDFSYCCYLSDLAVDKEFQKVGIGKEMVRILQEQIGEELSLLLLASPIAMEYYPRIGFAPVHNGYMIPRKR